MASYIVEEEKLTGEYAAVFEKVEAYGMLTGMDSQKQEEMFLNLIDLLYTAQQEGKPVTKIIGNDVKQFCKDYFQEERGVKGFIKEIPSMLYRLSIIILIFGVLELVFREEPIGSVWNVTMEVGGFLVGIGTAFFVSMIGVWLIRPIILRLKKGNTAFAVISIFGIWIVTLILGMNWFGESVIAVPLMPLIIGFGVYIIIYKSYQLNQRYKKTGTFKKPPKDGTFREIYRETSKTQTPGFMQDRFRILNKRRRRRGKQELTKMEFTEKMRREYKNGERVGVITMVFLWMGTTISDVIQGQGWLDIIVCAVILILVYRWMNRLYKSMYTPDLLEQCAKERIDIFELQERSE